MLDLTHVSLSQEDREMKVLERATPRHSPAPLRVLTALFERLHADGFVYCHWKSNEHLLPALAGQTDLDLLVERNAAGTLAQTVCSMGFKRFVVKPGRGYPGIEDYLGFDPDTGRLTHLHIHYQLTVGAKFLKGHRLPWESEVLAGRVLDEAHGVYVADPNMELLVLVVRAAMKIRTRDVLGSFLGRTSLPRKVTTELPWLVERIDPERLRALAVRLVGERAAGRLFALIASDRPTLPQLRAFGASVHPALSEYRIYPPVRARLRRWATEWTTFWHIVGAYARHGRRTSGRTPPQGGLTVAIVGADGAGKSTVTREMARWLAREVSTVAVYGGSGRGSASWSRRALQFLIRLRRRVRPARPVPVAAPDTPPPPRAARGARLTGLRGLVAIASTLLLARERRRKSHQVRRARGSGKVVICDRLPQGQFPGLNDGPRLSHWLDGGGALQRLAARAELAAIRAAELLPPDLVIKLHVSPEVALARHADTPPDEVRRKIEIVRRLRYPAATVVADVVADRPLPDVLLEVKRLIWETL